VKLVTIYKEPLKGDERLYPRDVRNYIASIMQGDPEVHSIIMGHERKQPTFIFSMPNRKSFGIYSFKRGNKIKEMMNLIKKRIEENPVLKIGGANASVGRVYTTPFEFTRFEDGLFERRLRTPLIIASAEFEYAECRKLSADGTVDMAWLKKFTTGKIKETISLMARDWFDEEEQVDEIMEETIILLKDLEYTPIKYKEGQYFPAVRGTIISNKALPLFIGYKSGLGYGELSSLKEMDRRKK